MNRISQLMSTPVANSSPSEKEYAVELSPPCIFPSPFDCCPIDPLTGSHLTCRRSPRLLTNGYYIWTEDSFLCDKDGNTTLSPSQTSVLYKENLVKIFRKKKRIRRSFSSLFNLSASESWLHGNTFVNADSSPNEDVWLEGVRRLETNHCNENGGGLDCSLMDNWKSEKLNAESVKTSFSSHVTSRSPGENSHNLPPRSQFTASEPFQENILDHPKTSLLGEVSFQATLFAACLIISACARWFLGGIIASVFTCSLVITIAYVVKSFLLSLANSFKATTCTWFCQNLTTIQESL
ncbi:transmembrane protein 71 isoform X1 [Sagmatias obliquidens]|uniref:transmembrane protein 71 isoform X1 n=1 Tax=Sagmatias obliquidens TaxID=3371155 RepID=UPI000F443808|nr:transmembrane protein 71 isoform X1 [Lagenorhynchus obliquidens]XP_026988292.1 transmembrane protein 71 isoform X1 [Lagenorhynchus obliquidens]XP_026988293.1 transmembrane protein 71 isoform X1 [Lagenorhynchus obliquidens]XP_026988294.1 transmembrane protein 71 isoform X1 [Lagenorhynchus obliquidens]XP_026988295.1 transmembrane protein 71 isoform X1 [Lagenorhynchus obliquidens]